MSAAASSVSSLPSLHQALPPSTADYVLCLAARDPSTAATILPDLLPDALDDLLSSLSAASAVNHLPHLPRLLSLSPSPAAVAAFFSALYSAPSRPSATLLVVACLLRDLPPAYRTWVPAFLTKIISLPPQLRRAAQLSRTSSSSLGRSRSTRVVLTGLLHFFGGRSGARLRAPPFIARQVEGTVLMHVAFAVKQAQVNLGKSRLLWFGSRDGQSNRKNAGEMIGRVKLSRWQS